MYIIAGLGNPGLKYRGTRHNCGFAAIDELAKKLGARWNKKQFSADTAECRIGGEKALLLKPRTYMNLSGSAVAEAMRFYKLAPDRVIVIYDDVDLDAGHLRIREKGSAGTHNGMRSIVECLGTGDFPRVRIGIGKNPPQMDLAAYVLGRIPHGDRAMMERAFSDAADAAAEIVKNGVAPAQQRYNQK